VYVAKRQQAEPLTTETFTAAEPLTTAEPLPATEPLTAAEPLTAKEPLPTEPIDQAPPINLRRIKENRVSDLFDYREEEDEARADPLHIEELTSECINCRALVTYSVNTQTEQCRNSKAVIHPKHASDIDKLQRQLGNLILTDKVEKEDVTEQRSLLQDFLEDDEDEYFDDEE
jgi:hypothetical protein